MGYVLATARGFAGPHDGLALPPHAGRNDLLMSVLVVVLVAWGWWRITRAP